MIVHLQLKNIKWIIIFKFDNISNILVLLNFIYKNRYSRI